MKIPAEALVCILAALINLPYAVHGDVVNQAIFVIGLTLAAIMILVDSSKKGE